MLLPTATTRLAAVIGNPVRHSLSPTLHNAAFAALGLDWTYVAFEVQEGAAADALAAMRVLGIEGLSVTMPHKADVAAAVDRMSPVAARLGAVNCVCRDTSVVAGKNLLIGENTDGEGFLRSLAYHPIRTALLEAAALRGAFAVNGLGMLLHQAGLAFELWTGEPAPIGAMRTAVLDELAARSAGTAEHKP
jgi:shikimate dehydrogenase